MESKAEFRKTMIERRSQMSKADYVAGCGYVCEKLLTVPMPPRSIIAGYETIRGEVNIASALAAYHDKKYRLCLPTITVPERIMAFRAWRPRMPMKRGAHGTMEPDGGETLVPTVVLVPLVAYDRAGYRIGYGAGYYDATLAHLKKDHPQLCTVGIAFSFQEVEQLPRESHDVRLDMIVTEKDVIFPLGEQVKRASVVPEGLVKA